MSDKKVETKPEIAKSESTILAEAVKLVAEQMIPAAVAAAVAATSQRQAAQVPAGRFPAAVNHERCQDCGQIRTGCNGKHVLAVVYPLRYPMAADYFTGVVLNGVKYMSNNSSHKVLIPADAESSILNIVANFEQNEQDQALGRKAERSSGVVSPNGANFVPANSAWR